VDADIGSLAHGFSAGIAGIKMILAGLPFQEFAAAGSLKALGGGLVGLEFLGHIFAGKGYSIR
jgi:hypothetical protein